MPAADPIVDVRMSREMWLVRLREIQNAVITINQVDDVRLWDPLGTCFHVR